MTCSSLTLCGTCELQLNSDVLLSQLELHGLSWRVQSVLC